MIRNCYFIKLGAGGKWAEDLRSNTKARIGWRNVPLPIIHEGDWGEIERLCLDGAARRNVGMADKNALKKFVDSTSEDLWITFHDGRMWWGRLSPAPLQEDEVSKYREMEGGWRCTTFQGDKELLVDLLPSRLTKTQAFRATICNVAEKELVGRILADEFSAARRDLDSSLAGLSRSVAAAIQHLHWKDFELLVDLLFRQSGWRRVGLAGETVKDVDLVLECPMTSALYAVQVKSRANFATALRYKKIAARESFEDFFFAVHTPSDDLEKRWVELSGDDGFTLLGPRELSPRVVQAGLAGWVRDRTF